MVNDLIHHDKKYRAVLANSDQRQSLTDHLLAVCALAMHYAQRCNLPEEDIFLLGLACINHDVGKLTLAYQELFSCGNLKFNTSHARHQEISWLAFKILESQFGLNKTLSRKLVAFLIYWHHAKPFYWSEPDGKAIHKMNHGGVETARHVVSRIDANEFIERILPYTYYVNSMFIGDICGRSILEYPGYGHDDLFIDAAIPEFYYCDSTRISHSIELGAKFHLMRSLLVRADRHVASLSREIVQGVSVKLFAAKGIAQACLVGKVFDQSMPLSSMPAKIFDFPAVSRSLIDKSKGTRFENLALQQVAVAQRASSATTAILHAGAGFGKTVTGLLYASLCQEKTPRQILWVVPRNSIAESLGRDIPKDLELLLGKGHKVSVEVFLTGKRVEGLGVNLPKDEFSADIVITNIDNSLNPVMKHQIADRIFRIHESIIIFDEFHEIAASNPMFFYFMQLVHSKHNTLKTPTLLLSASPLPLHKFWDGSEQTLVIDDVPHWNTTKAKLTYVESDEFDIDGGFLVVNSVNEAVRAHVTSHTKHLAHGRFCSGDKTRLISNLIHSYGKDAHTLGAFDPTTCVSSALFIQAAFNISHKLVKESILSPMKTIQVFGRLNRFDECQEPEFVCQFSAKNPSELSTANRVFSSEIRQKWAKFLKDRSIEVPYVNAEDLKAWYKTFVTEHADMMMAWLNDLLVSSIKAGVDLPPIQKVARKGSDTKKQISSKGNLREAKISYFASAFVFEINKKGVLRPLNKVLSGESLFSINEIELRKLLDENKAYCAQNGKNIASLHTQFNELGIGFEYPRPVKRLQARYDEIGFWKRHARFGECPAMYFPHHMIYVAGNKSESLPPMGLIETKVLRSLGFSIPKSGRGRSSDESPNDYT